MIYQHSFRNNEIAFETGVRSASKDGCEVFVHNVIDGEGLPEKYDRCDVFNSEISWRVGYKIFAERAGVDSGNYNDYISKIGTIIRTVNKPFILLTGKREASVFPTPSSSMRVMYNGHMEMIYGWRIDVEKYKVTDNDQFVRELAKDFNCIGDFSCGYGAKGKIFKELGKTFVMSDINERCVTFVAREIMGWESSD